MKRRRIPQWYRQLLATRKSYTCTQCDTVICTHSIYEREVLASARNIEVERYHISPPCPDSYYTGK